MAANPKQFRTTGIRVNLTLPPDAVAVLDRIAAASGTGRATMLREVVIDGLPMFKQMADALEAAKAKNLDAFSMMSTTIDQLAGETQQMSLEMKRTSRRMRRKKKT